LKAAFFYFNKPPYSRQQKILSNCPTLNIYTLKISTSEKASPSHKRAAENAENKQIRPSKGTIQ